MNNSYVVLNTIQALAADVVWADHILQVNSTSPAATGPRMDYRKIESAKITHYAAGTAQVTTLTPTAAAGVFRFTISQTFADGSTITKTLSYTATAADTATTISNAFKAIFNTYEGFTVGVSATGAVDIVFTAVSPDFLFTVSGATSNIAIAATTPGVSAKGTPTLLAQAGVAAADISSAGQYSTYVFIFKADSISENASNVEGHRATFTVYADELALNWAAFNTRMDEVLNAYTAAGTASNPEAIAIGTP